MKPIELTRGAIGVLAIVALGIAVIAAVAEGAVLALVALVLAGVSLYYLRFHSGDGLSGEQMDRLRRAELALAAASDPHDAARELADQTRALLGARSAVVLVEGVGDTVRVVAGPDGTQVYGSGSRMRLLADAGVPCGSIAVSERADGRPYTDQHERILDTLAERVSSTLHQLSLLGEVRAERRKLADILASSTDGIFAVGPDLSVRVWNPAMERITGVPAARAIGEPASSSFQPTDGDGRPRWGAHDPGRSGQQVESILLRIEPDGELRWVLCSYSPLSDGGYVAIVRDDTERKKLQDDKDGWIAQVSHELRTPLTPIKGFLNTLQRRDAELSTEDRAKIYEVMLREEQRLERLVTSLLQATQLDQGGLVVIPEPVDWPAVVREQVDTVARQDPGREFELEIGGDVDLVMADEELAVGVLTNLLSNALKYSPEGAPVEISVDRDENRVITSVIDGGPGVPRSDRERIFDKFTRLGDHLTRPQQGVGLGLYIARQSVERMGGQIWVDEAPGGGAAFRFSLPVSGTRRRRAPMRAARDG